MTRIGTTMEMNGSRLCTRGQLVRRLKGFEIGGATDDPGSSHAIMQTAGGRCTTVNRHALWCRTTGNTRTAPPNDKRRRFFGFRRTLPTRAGARVCGIDIFYPLLAARGKQKKNSIKHQTQKTESAFTPSTPRVRRKLTSLLSAMRIGYRTCTLEERELHGVISGVRREFPIDNVKTDLISKNK
ncbi:hypothetical protein EVAR_49727_1 [Eumeta japonica]|uniref:Uncharacterized protein n=1 Tax=Eumeta variegata TaxID=151549 RepID=A0A4C1ZTU8_EUMVA|nr:hypothetical protein EVAR_49727_1 [Eumeta japonica]